MRIGVLGGSFDPIHNGHLYLAGEAQNRLCLDKVIVVPNWNNPLTPKNMGASADDRFCMAMGATAHLPRIELDSVEVDRKKVAYSIDVLQHIHKKWKKQTSPSETYFLVGADAASQMEGWLGIEEFGQWCTVAVHHRDDHNNFDEVLNRLGIPWTGIPDAGRMQVSSTDIRGLISSGLSFEHIVPPFVAMFIKNRRLYGYTPDRDTAQD